MAPITLLIVGAGRRGKVYANFAKLHPDVSRVVGVADTRPLRRAAIARDFGIPPCQSVADWHGLAVLPKFADAAVICLLDQDHLEAIEAFHSLGYHILCEKPMAVSIPHCVGITKLMEKSNLIFGVGHVMRYSPYNIALKQVIDSGVIGDIVNIQHLEPIGFEHFVHSYVRGNWRKAAESTFSLMAKSCHDIDILNFYVSGKDNCDRMKNRPKLVSSFGNLQHFKPSNKPSQAKGAERCTECPYEPECVYSAKRHYLDQFEHPERVTRETRAERFVEDEVLSPETIMPYLESGSYGECVYNGQNNVCDHQVVNIQYESGITASFTMVAFTDWINECERSTRIHGTKGQIIGDSTSFTVHEFLDKSTKTYSPPREGGSHGGGDFGISRAFAAAVNANDQSKLGATCRDMLRSHMLVFAAEKARLEGIVVDYEAFEEEALA